MSRNSSIERITNETQIQVELGLDGSGNVHCETGIPFFDHMLSQLGKHGGFDLSVYASGDIDVDLHHLVEDVGISIGQAFVEALGDKRGIRRFASLTLPLDEALVEVALDLSGRPYIACSIALPEDRVPLGNPGFEPQLIDEFMRAFATAGLFTLHISSRAGRNTHHILEASFKALARCLRDAVKVEDLEIPSTKGSL